MTSHLKSRSHTRCNMLLLDLGDGTSIGITDHDKPIDFDIGDGVVTYDAATGILPSDVALSIGLDADNYEVTGPIGETVTLEAIAGGRFNRARARLFQVNWNNPVDALKIMAGSVSEARVEGGRFTLEIRSDADRFNQVVGETITNNCKADFGDARCGVTPESIVGTVTGGNAFAFTVSFTGTYADDYFNMGKVTPLTGANAGGRKMEVLDWTSAGVVTLFAPLAADPEIGDTFKIETGCSKARLSDDPTVRTCKFYNNVVNFRGYPEVPGSDQVLRAAIPSDE